MKISLSLIALFIAAAILFGCSTDDIPTQLTALVMQQANVTCSEISFYLDPALGGAYECETVPESSSSDIPTYYVFIYPSHTELTIQKYPLTQTQFPPQIWIYPVSRFSELLPDVLPQRVSDLRNLVTGGTWGSGELPFLPAIPQVQSFFIHETVMTFNGGIGVRFITEYSEAPTPISNKNIIYTFQGLTDDGKYWVAVTLPISSPILPAENDMLPEGYTEESLLLNYNSYVNDVIGALEAQDPDSFFPTINSLDTFEGSITVGQ
jgi:hypothetical protein